MYWIGIDIGGTFTDMSIMREDGSLVHVKASTTPDDLIVGVSNVLAKGAQALGISASDLMSDCALFLSGTTIGLNALLQRKVGKAGLITTAGFGQIIRIMRGQKSIGLSREDLQDFVKLVKPAPLVDNDMVEEVVERMDCYGNVACPLDIEAARRAIRSLVGKGAESIAVSFAWAFRNRNHEQRVKEIAQEMYPDLPVYLSADVCPLIREFERTSVTAMHACIAGPVVRYARNLEEKLHELGYHKEHLLMQSGGGVIPSSLVQMSPANLIKSGPVGGVMGSQYMGASMGYENIITTDVGGTSFDVGIIADGYPVMDEAPVVARYPAPAPMIRVESIGTGGGSVAWIDELGALRVGPRSAGANPGPACYDRGGIEPTVTDADLILGYVDAERFAAGEIRLSMDRAKTALQSIADVLKKDIVEVASGIYEIVSAQCADLIRKVVLESGYDPRDFVLFAFGGAGATHACAFCGDLKPRKLIMCQTGPTHSAFGVLTSDIMRLHQMSEPKALPLDMQTVSRNMGRLRTAAAEEFDRLGISQENRYFMNSVSMQYGSQPRDIFVPLSERFTEEEVASLGETFTRRYEQLYGGGTAWRSSPINAITYQVAAWAKIKRPGLTRNTMGSADPSPALMGSREVFFAKYHDFVKTPVYDGTKRKAGMRISGPAIIEDPFTSSVILPDMEAEVDEYENVCVSWDTK